MDRLLIFVFHLNSMNLLDEFLLHKGNYNFTNFHWNQMKNKKVFNDLSIKGRWIRPLYEILRIFSIWFYGVLKYKYFKSSLNNYNIWIEILSELPLFFIVLTYYSLHHYLGYEEITSIIEDFFMWSSHPIWWAIFCNSSGTDRNIHRILSMEK